VHGSFGFKFDGTLDKPAISKAYFEGDFHRILPPLEAFRTSRATKSREDSVFVYKYLSVIYAADSTTRKKGESYMVQLLKLVPSIELVDMYISDNIEAIFKDVQGKYLKQQQYVRNHDDLGRAIQDTDGEKTTTEPRVAKKKSNGPPTWIWWTAGVGVAAAATTAYFVLQDNSEPSTQSDQVKP